MATDKNIHEKTKFVFEYELSSQSISMIWEAIATGPGLSAWFADAVNVSGKRFNFVWCRHESRDAELINCRQNTYVRFRWVDEAPGTYFEIRILKNDLTSNYSLEITDFGEIESDVKSLWDSSIDALRRCGL
jgi:hypothetical protein